MLFAVKLLTTGGLGEADSLLVSRRWTWGAALWESSSGSWRWPWCILLLSTSDATPGYLAWRKSSTSTGW